MEVDVVRKRIGLSMRLDDAPGERSGSNQEKHASRKPARGKQGQGRAGAARHSEANGTMAALFKEAMQKKK